MLSAVTPHIKAKYQPAECRNQGKVTIHRFEDHVERCEQYHDIHNVDQIAGDVDTKQCFVRHDVPGGIYSVARDDEAEVDAIVRKDHDRHREQESESCDSCSFILRPVEAADRTHAFTPVSSRQRRVVRALSFWHP